ncbi:MAG: tetratricopeptide repeat protein [Crocinitomicaceae bacterium]|nr:tetratricopeptide repeat protein [Crocinitomicaceae bacterium]
MRNITLILLLLFYFLNSNIAVSQKNTPKELIGIYYGKIRAQGSMSGQDIALRFYENGEVIAMLVSKRPAYIENFAKSFTLKGSGHISKGTYTLNKNDIEFKLNIVLKGKKSDYTFQGRLSFTKSVNVILFTVYSQFKNMGHRLYAENIWNPNQQEEKVEEEVKVEIKKEEIPSVVDNKKTINEQADELETNLEKENLVAATGNYNNIGLSHFQNKDYEEAINSFNDALVLSEMTGDVKASADIRNNLGVSHERLNQKNAALENFNKAAEAYMNLGDKESAAKVVYQISLLQKNHLDLTAEEDAFKRLLELESGEGNQKELSATYNSLAINLMRQSRKEEAAQYLEKSKAIDDKMNYDSYKAIAINNEGNIRFESGDVQGAIQLYHKALEIKKRLMDKGSEAITYHNLGNAFYSLGEFVKSEGFLKKSMELAQEAREAKTINANYRALANLLADSKSCSDPLDNYKSYISMRFAVVEAEEMKPLYEEKDKYLESGFNSEESLSDEVQKLGIGNDDLISINMLQEDLRMAQKEAKQERELKEKEVALLESQNESQKEKAKTLTWMVIGAGVSGVLVLFMLGLAIRAKNRTNKDKKKIEDQKLLIEEKNKNFMDSVTYASRLQTAILPPTPVLEKYLNEFFVFYKPKDIVAGDFYWTEKVDNYIYVAAADCTGHGVPGALVSVVCSNSLNRAVNEFGLRDTGEILDKTRELVIGTFEKSVEKVKDGMDISLVRFEKGKNEIQYSGANNSLLICRDRNEQELEGVELFENDRMLLEFKADKQPVGQYEFSKDFTTNRVSIQANDEIFLFSDGFADQFGGEKGKKMKLRYLKQMFLSLSSMPMDAQQTHLEETFENWKGDYEQVDDVCVIGIRV